MHKRQKWACRVCAVLALGVLTTVAVSWSLAFRDFNSLGVISENERDNDGRRVHRPIYRVRVYRDAGTLYVKADCFGPAYQEYAGSRQEVETFTTLTPAELLPAWAMIGGAPWLCGRSPIPRGDDIDSREMLARGFPFVSMYSVHLCSMTSGDTIVGGIAVPGYQVNHRQMFFDDPMDVVLPLLPAWRPFAGNTAFYAVAWVLVLTMVGIPPRVRRGRRRRAGRCESCGYDMKGAPGGCPECGPAAQ